MRKLFPQLLMSLAVLALPQILQAEDAPKPPQPSAESMFKRLDANKNGIVTADELPAGMPERMKQMLIKADKDGDKKLTPEELKEAFKDRRAEGQAEKRPEGRPEKRPEGRGEKGPEGRGEKGPGGPNPEVMFKRLDANKDGAVTAAELPEGMPERMKQMLIKADKNGDKKLTPEELKQAFKERREANRPEPRPEGRPGPRTEEQSRRGPPSGFGGFGGPGMGMGMQRGEGRMEGRPGMGPPSRPEGRPGPKQTASRPAMHPRGEGRPEMGLWQQSLQGIRANLPELPNLKVAFDRLDADKDGKLCFDEFQVGVTKLHLFFAAHLAGNPTSANRFAGGMDERQPQPWLTMRQAGWEPAGRPGPQFQGPGPQDRGPQFQGYAYGWQPGRGPQFHGYAHGWHPGPGPQFHGYAMNRFPGRGPQFHGRGMGHGPQFPGHGPYDRGPKFQGHGGYGPHSQGPWQD